MPDQMLTVLNPLRTSDDGSQFVTLALQPEGLGNVQATVTIVGQQISVNLWADSATGHAALSQTMSQLHSQLSDGTDRHVTVDLADFGSAQPDARQGQTPGAGTPGHTARRPRTTTRSTRIRPPRRCPDGRPPGRPAVVTEPHDAAAAPVFIVCNARSGSTLLRWLIDAHEEISCPGETDVAALLQAYVDSAQAVGLRPTTLAAGPRRRRRPHGHPSGWRRRQETLVRQSLSNVTPWTAWPRRGPTPASSCCTGTPWMSSRRCSKPPSGASTVSALGPTPR